MQAMLRSFLKQREYPLQLICALAALASLLLASPAWARQFNIQPYLKAVSPVAAKEAPVAQSEVAASHDKVTSLAPALTINSLGNDKTTPVQVQPGSSSAGAPPLASTNGEPLQSQVKSNPGIATADELVAEGDQLVISVFGQPDLSADLTVGESGLITLPLVGTLEVKGKSAAQIALSFTQKLEQGQYLRNPKVAVKLIQAQSRSFSVMGEVQRPGRYPLTSALSVLDGLSLAGGMTARADKQVRLLRRTAKQSDSELVEYAAVKLELDNGAVPEQLAQKLRPNDIIFVAQQKNFYVYGEVRKPGMYPIEDDLNVMRVLSIGGGVSERGSARRIVIHRKAADGKVREIPAQITDKVEPGDVVFVNERIF